MVPDELPVVLLPTLPIAPLVVPDEPVPCVAVAVALAVPLLTLPEVVEVWVAVAEVPPLEVVAPVPVPFPLPLPDSLRHRPALQVRPAQQAEAAAEQSAAFGRQAPPVVPLLPLLQAASAATEIEAKSVLFMRRPSKGRRLLDQRSLEIEPGPPGH